MTKKTRRVRRPKKQIESAVGVTPATATRRRRGSRQIIVTEEQLREEYAYVIRDLRHILVLALIMFILLIAANIAWPYLGIG